MNRWALAVLSGAVLMLPAPLIALGQSPEPPARQAYRPGLGDLMTMTVQPRHIKLLLGAREQNWVYLHEMQEAFDRVVRVWPKYRGLPLGGMVDSIIRGPMDELGKAIERKDEVAFDAAYEKLTEGCNACHQAANVGQIVIKVPSGSTFPDQDFRPREP
jgi:hypothetical protein